MKVGKENEVLKLMKECLRAGEISFRDCDSEFNFI